MTALTELAFPAMGTSARLLATPGAPLHEARALVEDLEARLTRFDPQSELSALNADARETVPASHALRDAVKAAIAGAAATGGLADPTLLGAVVRAGYDRSLVGHPRAGLQEALAAAPDPRPAAPSPAADWRHVRVDDASGTIARPPGVHLDLGGSAKGLAADLAADLLAPHGPCAADLGGDLRVRGTHEVLVPNPVTGMLAEVLELQRRRGRHLGHRQADLVGREPAGPPTTCSTRRRSGPPGPACSAPPPRRRPRRWPRRWPRRRSSPARTPAARSSAGTAGC